MSIKYTIMSAKFIRRLSSITQYMTSVRTNTPGVVLMSLLILMVASALPATTSLTTKANTLGNQALAATGTPSPIDPACLTKMEDAMHLKAAALDNSKAVAMAAQDNTLKSKIGEDSSKFNSIFNTWKLNPADCTVSWQTVNVVYSVSNATGYVKMSL